MSLFVNPINLYTNLSFSYMKYSITFFCPFYHTCLIYFTLKQVTQILINLNYKYSDLCVKYITLLYEKINIFPQTQSHKSQNRKLKIYDKLSKGKLLQRSIISYSQILISQIILLGQIMKLILYFTSIHIIIPQ